MLGTIAVRACDEARLGWPRGTGRVKPALERPSGAVGLDVVLGGDGWERGRSRARACSAHAAHVPSCRGPTALIWVGELSQKNRASDVSVVFFVLCAASNSDSKL